MAYAIRGKRVAYDNIASGAATGTERHFGITTSPSGYGNSWETGGFSNIASAALPGVEDTDNATADKLTSDGEDVTDGG